MNAIKIKIIFTLSLLIISSNSWSQIYKAGDTFSTYFDIIPDTLINYYYSPAGSSEDYYFDVNADTQYDFKLNATYIPSMGFTNKIIFIYSMNPNSYVKFGRYDSVFNNYDSAWWVTKIAKPLQYGDTINSAISEWDSTYLFLTDNSFLTGVSKLVSDWISTNDEFIGIKYQNTTDTIYGWIRVNCPNLDSLYIKEYSVGSLSTSIQDLEFGNINIYPNPSKDYLKIIIPERAIIDILNITGQITKSLLYDNNATSIDIRDLSSGFYFIRIKTKNNIEIKKIIKE